MLLGTLAMIELAGGLATPWRGFRHRRAQPVVRPMDCGSSSGSGAAVAAGLSDSPSAPTPGDRYPPSSFCGIAGVRPTFGRVSRHGAMALVDDGLGPMARSAEDCEAVLEAIAGPDPLDAWSADEPRPRALPTLRSRLKVGYVRYDFTKKGEKEVGAAVDRAALALRDASCARTLTLTCPSRRWRGW